MRTDARRRRAGPGARRGERPATLAEAVLRAGALLGWGAPDVIAFAEAVTGQPWHECGPHELLMVLAEYRDVAAAAAARAARRAAGPGGR